MHAKFQALMEMLWVSLKWDCDICGNALLLHNIISIFSVTDMFRKKSLKVLQFGAALAHIMSALCYYGIDSEQVNCTVSEKF